MLKILRGIYPPPPDRYSADLRNLIADMLRKNPKDRPSINAILRAPIIRQRIEKFLSQTLIQSEFSHTVLHKQGPLRAMPSAGAAGAGAAAAAAPKSQECWLLPRCGLS